MQQQLNFNWHSKTIRRIVFVLLVTTSASLLLSACGWRLRGSLELPDSVSHISLQGVARYSELGIAIHSAFDGTNSKLVSDPGQAKAMLTILSNRADRRVIATDGSGRASEYEVAYTLQFKLTDRAGAELIGEQTIRAKREYRFDPSNVLASDSELARLEKEMIRTGVQQMLRRIDAYMRKKTSGKELLKSGNSTK